MRRVAERERKKRAIASGKPAEGCLFLRHILPYFPKACEREVRKERTRRGGGERTSPRELIFITSRSAKAAALALYKYETTYLR